MPTPLAVLASRIRLEEKLILSALEKRGAVVEVIDSRRQPFRLDGRELPYAGALSREISHTRNVYGTRLLEHAGLTVVNSYDIISLCGDKLLTALALQDARLPVPRAMVSLSPEHAVDGLAEFGFPMVIKPVIGSWGRLASRPKDREAAETLMEHRAALASPQYQVVYAQEYIDKPGRDIKAYVMGGEVVGVIYKVSDEWRTNTARTGRAERCDPSDELVKLLVAVADVIGEGVFGIDVLEDRDGRFYVNEVNHTPEFHGAVEVLDTDLVGAYADYVLRRLPSALSAG
ncbi:hypothetical protein BS329_36145 [Amycolatopsis coloradensis]|uniref:ATP-grasp domain-containing protein n=1 Tax=Amycolatopsis coloradensis TaxID=76021 RepID=A0A1R0KG18_9PSEU|nr:RimK family alpha-L-glutamate ligase [Amycolatopsis coloradensis]OLZ44512.1 hypothetical protein BS329_36145 [Amycolatopsis coloradensis]